MLRQNKEQAADLKAFLFHSGLMSLYLFQHLAPPAALELMEVLTAPYLNAIKRGGRGRPVTYVWNDVKPVSSTLEKRRKTTPSDL